ncbi:alpha/beta fold hydrolase [Alteromonas sp. 345S023]|uniref:Alpha/beta fold hydrolase n=1 Tax=Alteromonas profundi TaxID=2696062 RepID=A0A7X5LMW2_9ALTE|nr:alpha/beta hydrolase [Alteromonas profundi]NDV92259.1 alpha/beta fold hydrolase [Alteromonas profundi]
MASNAYSSSNSLLLPSKEVPLPKGASSEQREAIRQFPSMSISEANASVPITAEQWRDYAQTTNARQKKKVKQMRKRLGVTVEQSKINGVTVRFITPKRLSEHFKDCVYIDVHGGAYVFFAGLPSIEEGMLIAHRLGIRVISVDYRMPPKHPFPAALNDVATVYKAQLCDIGAEHIYLGGTSAGAGLVLSLMQLLKRAGTALPAAIYTGTPWADLTKTGDTLFTNEGIDRVLVSYDATLAAAASLYADKEPLTNPLISPLYGDFEGLPPTLLVSGTRDMFLSDTVRVNRKLRDAGVVTQLEVFEGASHADYLIAYETPESFAVYRELEQFFIHYR